MNKHNRRVLSGLALLACLFTGCQQTPMEDAVINRGENPLTFTTMAPGAQNPVPYPYPERAKATYEDAPASLTIRFDATVEVPKAAKYSAIKVKRKTRSDAEISRLFSHFAKGAQLLYAPEATKEQLQEILVQIKRGRYVDGTYVVDETTHALAAQLEEKIRQAPAEANPRPFDFNISDTGEHFMAGSMLDCVFLASATGRFARLRAQKEGNSFAYCRYDKYIIQSQEIVAGGDALLGEPEGTQIIVEGCSEQDAATTAAHFLSDFDLSNFENDYIEAVRIIDPDTEDIAAAGWLCTFTRTVNALRVHKTFMSTSVKTTNPPTIVAPWEWERVHIMVDRGGIAFMEWKGASEVIETVAENIELLPFESLMDKIAAQLKYNHAVSGLVKYPRTITITRMRLGTSLLTVANEPDYGQYVPTWYAEFTYSDDHGVKYDDAIMFTAHDGGYVEPRLTSLDLMYMVPQP